MNSEQWTVRAAAQRPEFYNDAGPGETRATGRLHRKPPSHKDRTVIMWDSEGISHRERAPQSTVLFGCSVEWQRPIVDKDISMETMLQYIISIGQKNPHAIHVGYYFDYDANMIIKGMRQWQLTKLWETGRVVHKFGGYLWRIEWRPHKWFQVTRWKRETKTKNKRHQNQNDRITVRINDIGTFFAMSFLRAMESTFKPEELDATEMAVLERGKLARGEQSWTDIKEIEEYWKTEIRMGQRLFERFREVMYAGGIELTEWYGPGAIANYLIASRGIRPHLGSVQVTSGTMPQTVHTASKHAFFGGRFELFQAGRINGPIYAIDINSAYPYALTQLPSFHPDSGQWIHVQNVQQISVTGVYRIRYVADGASPFEQRPMPLPYRDNRGMISFPSMVHGWYWGPEASIVSRMKGAEILEGWVWKSISSEKPFAFLQEMYDERMRIGKKNIMSMPYKLGPNSIYGKLAQTKGWNQETNLPPRSHALPVAGMVTSFCRAMLFSVMLQIPDQIIAVETDGIYTTADPHKLSLPNGMGDKLGQWDYTVYDEMMYIQSGMYHTKTDGEWKGTRSRGISAAEYPPEVAENYLKTLNPGEEWERLRITTGKKFVGLGAAIASQRPTKMIHGQWETQVKNIGIGDTGKRKHYVETCELCRQGVSPWDQPHRLQVHSKSDGIGLSHARRLPWEKAQFKEVQELRDNLEREEHLL